MAKKHAAKREPTAVAQPSKKASKTPSPKVIASEALRRAIAGIEDIGEDGFTNMCGSKVSGAKREKVLEQVGKITASLRKRLDACVNKHYGS